MSNKNETVANVHDDMLQVVADEFGNVTMAQSDFVEYAVRFLAAHKREIDELKKQVSIAKDAFFKIAQRKHSREVHDIVCEAEFMMNHPECRNEATHG